MKVDKSTLLGIPLKDLPVGMGFREAQVGNLYVKVKATCKELQPGEGRCLVLCVGSSVVGTTQENFSVMPVPLLVTRKELN